MDSKYFLSLINKHLYKVGYCFECINQVNTDFNAIVKSNHLNELEKIVNTYDDLSYNYDSNWYKDIINQINILSNLTNINAYKICLIVCILLSYNYSLKFVKLYPKKILKENLKDFIYQSNHCFKLYGFYGLHAMDWSLSWFILNRFTFHQLQFEGPVTFNYEYLDIHKDTLVINVHIPRTGERLNKAKLKTTFKQGKQFFEKYFSSDKKFRYDVFKCSSWLLSPVHKKILNKESNILAFINEFDLIYSDCYKDYNEVWRLFDTFYDGDISKLPNDTSLRKEYIQIIKRKEKTMWGVGVHIEK